MLKKKYEERLGFKNDFDEVRNHEFFKEINFSDLTNKKIGSPYKPQIIDIENEGIKKIKKRFTYDDLIKNGINFDH